MKMVGLMNQIREWGSILTVNMQIDQYTYNDLSIFQAEEEFSVFHRLNFTRTAGGMEWLKK